eukprot:6444943-Amphidinium_carterae.3
MDVTRVLAGSNRSCDADCAGATLRWFSPNRKHSVTNTCPPAACLLAPRHQGPQRTAHTHTHTQMKSKKVASGHVPILWNWLHSLSVSAVSGTTQQSRQRQQQLLAFLIFVATLTMNAYMLSLTSSQSQQLEARHFPSRS